MLGDTASPCIPTTQRYKHLVGKNVILPLVGRMIPIVADEYSDPEKGTGAVEDHAGARLQRFRGRQASQAAADQSRSTKSRHDRTSYRGPARGPPYRGLSRRSSRPQEDRRRSRSGSACWRSRSRSRHACRMTSARASCSSRISTDQWYRRTPAAGREGDRRGARARTRFVPENWDEDVLSSWMKQHPRPGASRASSGGAIDPVCPDGEVFAPDRGRSRQHAVGITSSRRSREEAARCARSGKRGASSSATRTCSTPGSRRRCGRSRRWAGRTRRRS